MILLTNQNIKKKNIKKTLKKRVKKGFVFFITIYAVVIFLY